MKASGIFAVFSQPRTGTHLLREYLNCHPGIHCDGELFHPAIAWPQLQRFYWRTPAARVIAALAEDAGGWGKTYGFEAHDPGTLNRVRFDWRPEVLREIDPPPRILWLRRKNLVAQYASWVIAMKTGRWVVFGNQKAVPQTIPALRPDPEEAADWIARRVETRLELQETLADFDSIQVEYERLCEKPQAVCAEIFRFLGLPPARVKTRTISLRNYRTTRVLGNYEEIVEVLQVRLAPEVVRKWMCR